MLPELRWQSQNREVRDNPGGIFLPEVRDTEHSTAKAVFEAAEKYWEVVGKTEEASVHAAFEAAEAGDALLTVAGHYKRAVSALRAVWHQAHGTHLDGVFDPALDSLVDRPLLRYVRH